MLNKGTSSIKGQFAVLGCPVEHSQSPQIQQAFARQFDTKINYIKLLAEPDHFAPVLEQFFDKGGQGANITLPFKQKAYELCLERTTEAEAAKAVNTIWRTEKWCGANTDGLGLKADLMQNMQIKISGQRLLIIGAGGATRGILGPLLQAKPEQIVIANRTLIKAERLVQGLGYPKALQTASLDSLATAPEQPFDLIIQASALGHHGELPILAAELCHQDSICYELSYGCAAQPFLNWARASAAALATDGLGMLVEQAALSFALWFGQQPSTKAVINNLRRR